MFVKRFMTNEFQQNQFKLSRETLETDFKYGTEIKGLTGAKYLGDPVQGWLEDYQVKKVLKTRKRAQLKFSFGQIKISITKQQYTGRNG
ncbi:hypothetical protein [Fictibacillus gelatini]|uniref:hypothetical protein n=1 Tax=Fictibacillus gelatini TaxID=225985 RepID=UPI00047C6298|nr:hypothetical protein [Fictibacillus gelatini]